MATANKRVMGIRRFFTDTGLPLFLLTAIAIYEAFLLAIVFAPAEATDWWGGFAEEFKRWCFSYDPRTGGMEYASVVVMLIEPLFIGLITAFVWRKALLAMGKRKLDGIEFKSILSGSIAGLAVIAGLLWIGKPSTDSQAVLPFPGERIRVSLDPPPFRLQDQRGEEFGLEDALGDVVLVTGVYAMCANTCPDILIQTRDLLDRLPEEVKASTTVVALSLNPEYDTRDLMNRVAEGYGFEYPQFRYINGDLQVMEPLLQRFGFSRSVDPQTGVVDHANLFLLLDRRGKIAYRLTLDKRHSEWLVAAALDLGGERYQDLAQR